LDQPKKRFKADFMPKDPANYWPSSDDWSDSRYEGDVVEEESEECDAEYYQQILECARSLKNPPDAKTWHLWKEITDNYTFVHEE
jgi:hypothetical protein